MAHALHDPFRDSPSESPPSGSVPPDPTRTGAIWVTGTGAFLLIAAAVALVATHWSTLSDQVKFAILALVTAGCLLAGRRLRPLLPATAGVLFHLGALLLPINVAALLLDTGVTWPTQLVVQGATAAATFTLLAALEDSVVLRVGAGIGVVVLAAGLGATFESLAGAGAGRVRTAGQPGRRRQSGGGLGDGGRAGPAGRADERFASMPTPVIHELGMVGRPSRMVAARGGAAAALVIGRAAGARQHPAGGRRHGGGRGGRGDHVGRARSLGRHDLGWRGGRLPPARAGGPAARRRSLLVAAGPGARHLGRVVAGTVVTVATGWALVAAGADAGRAVDRMLDLPVVFAAGLAALAWLAADLRRRAGTGHRWASPCWWGAAGGPARSV